MTGALRLDHEQPGSMVVHVTQMSPKRHRCAAGDPYALNGLNIVDKLLEFALMMLAQGAAPLIMAPRASRPPANASCAACATRHRPEARLSRSAVGGGARRAPVAQRRRAPRRKTDIVG
jgi:hypothetical protein